MSDGQGKPIWHSRTFWINLLTAIAGVLGVFLGSDLIAEHPEVAAGLVSALGVVNVILRVITGEPVVLLPPPKEPPTDG